MESSRAAPLRLVIAGALLLGMLSACGGSNSNPTSTTAPLTDGTTNPALASSAQPATPANERPESSSAEIPTTRQTGEIELPGNLTIGTPKSGEPIAKDIPTSEMPASAPTPRRSSFDIDGDGILSTEELIQAVATTYPLFTWPPGYHFDLDTVIADIEVQATKIPSQYENGAEQTILGFPYLCAWQYTLRDAIYAGDDDLIAESLERLRAELATNPNFVEIRTFNEDALDKAELGDPGALQQLIEIMGCSTMQWKIGTPITTHT